MNREEALETLGFERQSSPGISEIKNAYRSKAKEFHPDKHSEVDASEKARFERLFYNIANAYQFLLRPLSEQLPDTFVRLFNPYKLYEESMGEHYDPAEASDSKTTYMRFCGLFAGSGMKEDDIKISTHQIFRYEDGSRPGFSHTFRTLKYEKEYWKSFITPFTESFKIHDYGARVSAADRESLATLLSNSPQIQHISCPPDFFNRDQVARIGRIASSPEQLELHSATSSM
ncbi:hypothetical protein E3226_010825 [Legionella geestiana]|uniref:DnaJ domain-containing protein n=1 Tax=Legionella geestiana TaxID=45065 RepID=UPI0010928B90|nr:DnaJ domain-containing protein [Legionella geestiana]QDQ40857.1 hypothetical protein E3226_010825 [Legionella geestiana]